MGLGVGDNRRAAQPPVSDRSGREDLEGSQGRRDPCPRAFPQLKTDKYPDLPEKITFMHAEDILDKYPDLPRKQRETAIMKLN